jgi:hypothetical protein
MNAARLVAISCFVLMSLMSLGLPQVSAQNAKALLLFGGDDHKTFLGCLNCVDTSSVSICNDVGEFGSDVASNSIWNDVGEFGSDVSAHSPWNDVSNDAPIIVDSDGNSYGYFSANSVHHDRTRIPWLLAVLDYYEKTSDLEKTRKMMCGD